MCTLRPAHRYHRPGLRAGTMLACVQPMDRIGSLARAGETGHSSQGFFQGHQILTLYPRQGRLGMNQGIGFGVY